MSARLVNIVLLAISQLFGNFLLAEEDKPALTQAEILTQIEKWEARVKRHRQTGEILSIDFGETKITDADLAILSHLSGLQELEIDRTKVTDEGLVHLKTLTKLQALDLEFTTISGEGFIHLKDMKVLRSLDLEGTKITVKELEKLHAMKQLRTLDLRNTAITEGDAKELKKALPNVVIRVGRNPRGS